MPEQVLLRSVQVKGGSVDVSSKYIVTTETYIKDPIYGYNPSSPLIFGHKTMKILDCYSVIDGPNYIPVLRYETAGGTLYFDKYDPDNYCGTYYYLEPESNVYLQSNNTLIVPDIKLAYYHMYGRNAEASRKLFYELYEIISNIDEAFLTKLLSAFHDFIESLYIQCIGSIQFDQPFHKSLQFKEENFEQKVCFHARQLGIEVIIITGLIDENPEVIDTRPRPNNYNYLFRAT